MSINEQRFELIENMEELGNDILYFRKIFPESLCKEINDLIEENYERIFNRDLRHATFPFEGIRGRIEIYKFPELMERVNSFWFSEIEDRMYDHYFKWISDQEQIAGYKKHAKTEWKDLFVQVYNRHNTFELEENVHCDFSGITFVCCLKDEYTGGNLIFPKQGISLKLEKGDLVLFPGSHTHPHGITKLSGERRVLVGQSMGAPQLHKFGKEI
jgi:hypothetical protein